MVNFQWVNNVPKWTVGVVLAAGIVAISTSAVLVRLCVAAAGEEGVGFSLVVAALRLSVASILCIPLWRGITRSQVTRQGWQLAIASGICLATHFALWITSLSYTSIAAATTLVTTNPLWVTLIQWTWQRKKPHPSTVGGIAIALFGGILIAHGSNSAQESAGMSLIGNALALMAALVVSIYLILGQQAQNLGWSLRHYIVIVTAIAALCLVPIPPLMGVSYGGYPLPVYVTITLMALLPQLMGHTAINWAVRQVSPALVAIGILCEPVGATVLGYGVFGEVPTKLELLGAAVVLLGVAISLREPERYLPSEHE